ncbi:MAG: hypothetical protein GY724_19375 [Actinomycetia bacterium]|nr:hypothetical protein [Actinomycetes bacterium]MCP4224042.1 hypothetical protein [Actinomycetes bacterium]MCP5032269.1 hypothetical protein [Actinomycetes bacterium]
MSVDDETQLVSVRRVLVSVAWGLVLGLIVVLSVEERRQASVELWLVFVAGWLAWLVTVDLLKLAPIGPERLTGIWRRRRHRGVEPQRPRPLISLEGLLLSARDNERAMSLRLRPRLRELTEHFLATRHGIDLESSPERAAIVLGDLVPLIDPRAPAREVDLDDIERLFDILAVDQQEIRASEDSDHE